MITEILMCAGAALMPAGAMWYFAVRPLRDKLEALETQMFAVALPAAQEEYEREIDRQIALAEADEASPEQIEAIRAKKALVAGRDLTAPDPGIEIGAVNKRAAVALAKHSVAIGRRLEKLQPADAAFKWPPGTVFRDVRNEIFIVTHRVPLCVYQSGVEVEKVAAHALAEFKGGAVELLVTPAELRANRLIT